MKTVFVNRFYYPDQSATAQILTDVTRALVRAGHRDICVITSGAEYGAEKGTARSEDASIRVYRVPALAKAQASLVKRALNYAIFLLGAGLLLLGIARRGDLVIFKTDPPLLAAFLAPVLAIRRARFANWLQDIFPETAERLGMLDKGGALARLSRRWRNHALRRADATIVIGKRMRDFVARRGVKRASIHLVANWADERAIHPVPPSANPLREEWGYANDDMVVGYSGNLGRAHDASAFVDAMRAAVQPVHEDIRFLFVGGGAGLDPVRKAAASLPPDTIAFRPYQPRDRLALSLSVPDIHWLSLRPQLEGLIVPSKFYGIAAAARPVLFIGDTNGEIAGIIREAQCGASFAPDDTHSLVEFLRYLRQSPAERASMGANARAWLDEHAAIDRQLAAWVNLVDSIHPARN